MIVQTRTEPATSPAVLLVISLSSSPPLLSSSSLTCSVLARSTTRRTFSVACAITGYSLLSGSVLSASRSLSLKLEESSLKFAAPVSHGNNGLSLSVSVRPYSLSTSSSSSSPTASLPPTLERTLFSTTGKKLVEDLST